MAQTPAAQVAAVHHWRRAAAAAVEARYFGHFAANGVFMGADATERWTVSEFRGWAKPHFQSKKAWNFKPRDRQIAFSADGKTAWFDETGYAESGRLPRLGRAGAAVRRAENCAV